MFDLDVAASLDIRSVLHAFFTEIELQHVARHVESDLPISTLSYRIKTKTLS